ncbi:uncharacterized protein KY384_004865 [Bacidia gigantensis]|uniref:uncharacterized protein n=1 Tax=Bacidia gigantensis TaxID=2732470 RepID=UPI001D048686|nr:uncharacterized protein KY384_004865 [Bacidia gigantensis]KAG8530363.1 hypothetical protein KY384_004865 [Bacidia gigantensis]
MTAIRASTFFRSLIIFFTVLIVCGSFFGSRLGLFASLRQSVRFRQGAPALSTSDENLIGRGWPQIIWQTSKRPDYDLYKEEREVYNTWRWKNPDYQQELMTDEKMEEYVRKQYPATDVEKVYFEMQDYIMRSDLIRYLILLKDGGLYSDLDVGCEKPINQWLPLDIEEQAGVVLGVEVDNKFGPDGRTFDGGEDLFELVNWTIMTRPGQPFMRFLVKRVINNVRRMTKAQENVVGDLEHSVQQVLDTTGPGALTAAFFDYASDITRSKVTYQNFTKMTEPRLVGEVVILPIYSFGAGHQVQWGDSNQRQRRFWSITTSMVVGRGIMLGCLHRHQRMTNLIMIDEQSCKRDAT